MFNTFEKVYQRQTNVSLRCVSIAYSRYIRGETSFTLCQCIFTKDDLEQIKLTPLRLPYHTIRSDHCIPVFPLRRTHMPSMSIPVYFKQASISVSPFLIYSAYLLMFIKIPKSPTVHANEKPALSSCVYRWALRGYCFIV